MRIPETAVGRDASNDRIQGLDSLRFLCAYVVVIYHLGSFHIYGSSLSTAGKLLAGFVNCATNGSAAVIVFFVISGFCIHFPYRLPRRLELAPFFVRRYVRIVIPAVAYWAIAFCILHKRISPSESVLWSVVCETIYYTLYPFILFVRRRSGWGVLFLPSVLAAVVVVLTHVNALQVGLHLYTALPSYLWILGLPCWLLGCWLAENFHRFRVPTRTRMWIVRTGIYLLSVVLMLVRYHVTAFWASDCITLDLFAIPVCYWLGLESRYCARHKPAKLLEWAGTWSYSLYLAHPLVGDLLVSVPIVHKCGSLLLLMAALPGAFIFFLLFELPSHKLAVAMGRALKRQTQRPLVPKTEVQI